MKHQDNKITGTKANIIITDDIGLTENDATDKIRDWEARIAVEGDTDLNHDNIEAAE